MSDFHLQNFGRGEQFRLELDEYAASASSASPFLQDALSEMLHTQKPTFSAALKTIRSRSYALLRKEAIGKLEYNERCTILRCAEIMLLDRGVEPILAPDKAVELHSQLVDVLREQWRLACHVVFWQVPTPVLTLPDALSKIGERERRSHAATEPACTPGEMREALAYPHTRRGVPETNEEILPKRCEPYLQSESDGIRALRLALEECALDPSLSLEEMDFICDRCNQAFMSFRLDTSHVSTQYLAQSYRAIRAEVSRQLKEKEQRTLAEKLAWRQRMEAGISSIKRPEDMLQFLEAAGLQDAAKIAFWQRRGNNQELEIAGKKRDMSPLVHWVLSRFPSTELFTQWLAGDQFAHVRMLTKAIQTKDDALRMFEELGVNFDEFMRGYLTNKDPLIQDIRKGLVCRFKSMLKFREWMATGKIITQIHSDEEARVLLREAAAEFGVTIDQLLDPKNVRTYRAQSLKMKAVYWFFRQQSDPEVSTAF